jgi:glyoxylase I family protein
MHQFKSITHVSLLVADTQQALDFYVGVLGLEQIERPDLGFPGAWLAVGEQQIHLLELPNPDPIAERPEHGGRDRHIAFIINNLESLSQHLDKYEIAYTRSRSGRQALFCRDPDGNALELIAAH